MRTIERNYRKNPHTANFLMTFHTGGGNLPAEIDDNAAEYALAAEDLLNMVPVEHVADLRSEPQRKLIEKLIAEIAELDAETGAKARAYTDGMTARGKWTPGREGNVSAWIGRMITKANELGRTAPVAVPDGRYAVEVDGALRFYKIKNGRRPGFVFLDVQASEDWHPIRNLGKIQQVLAVIARDTKAAMIRYGQELGQCGHCGRTLTDATSRAAGIGPVCAGR